MSNVQLFARSLTESQVAGTAGHIAMPLLRVNGRMGPPLPGQDERRTRGTSRQTDFVEAAPPEVDTLHALEPKDGKLPSPIQGD